MNVARKAWITVLDKAIKYRRDTTNQVTKFTPNKLTFGKN